MKLYESAVMQSVREADIIDEATDDLTYLGYYLSGDSTQCLIKKIERTGSVTTIQYPLGRLEYSQIWANRASLTYTFKR